MKHPALKECPFCGSKARFITESIIDVTCMNRDCCLYHVKPTIAFTEWNTRAQTPVPNEHSQEGVLERVADAIELSSSHAVAFGSKKAKARHIAKYVLSTLNNVTLWDACNVALGHLTGGLDGDWRDCDPHQLLRDALAATPKPLPVGWPLRIWQMQTEFEHGNDEEYKKLYAALIEDAFKALPAPPAVKSEGE